MRPLLRVLCLLVVLTNTSPRAWATDAVVFPVNLTQGAKGELAIATKQAITLKAGQDQPIDVKCGTAAKPLDCTLYSLQYAKKDGTGTQAMSPGTITATDAQWKLTWSVVNLVDKCGDGLVVIALKAPPAGATPDTVAIKVSVPKDASCAAAAAPGADAKVPADANTSQVAQLVATDCQDEIKLVLAPYLDAKKFNQLDPSKLYNDAGDTANFIVAPNGDVLARPPEIIDENDVVNVTVVGNLDLLKTLHVTRTSDIRTLGTNYLGGSASVPTAFLKDKTCGEITVSLGDFKAGKADVTIAAQSTQGATPGTTTTGTVEFNVDTLYSGAFSLGPLYTTVKNPTFGLVGKGTGNVVTETDKGSDRVIVALVYTPFVWGRRDPEKDSLHSAFDYHRLNPMFGVVLNDVTNNAVVGLSYDLSSMVYLNLGVHFGKVKNIDPNSGLALGSTFTGTGTTVPTQTQWKTGFFVGFTVDLSAASKLYSLVSPPAKSQ